jgi:tetratricopeptide (TPR) repeat protein
MPPAASWRRRISQVAALLLLVPLVPAGVLSVRLASSAWMIGGMLPDPLVLRITSGEPEDDLDEPLLKASRRSSQDFRFPFRLGRDLWGRRKGPEGATALVRSHSLFGEAAGLAPTYAPCRLHLFWTSLALGEMEAADEQARAALDLAPMHTGIRTPVSRYFFQRYRSTKSAGDLRTAFRAVSVADERLVLAFLDDPLLSFEDFRTAYSASRLEAEVVLSLLEKASRWDWALRTAEELAARGGDGGLQGRTRLRYSEFLFDVGALESACEEAERAFDLLGGAFDGWLALGRARLGVVRIEAGFDALARALRSGVEAAEVESALSAAGLTPKRRAEFWAPHVEGGGAAPAVRLSLARALVDAGNAVEAEGLLRRLIAEGRFAGEAHYLLARAFLATGKLRIALKHAREAAKRAPDSEEFLSLMRELEKTDR